MARMLDKCAAGVCIEAVSPHTMRYTFATRYPSANPNDLRGLVRLLGYRI